MCICSIHSHNSVIQIIATDLKDVNLTPHTLLCHRSQGTGHTAPQVTAYPVGQSSYPSSPVVAASDCPPVPGWLSTSPPAARGKMPRSLHSHWGRERNSYFIYKYMYLIIILRFSFQLQKKREKIILKNNKLLLQP